MCAPEVSVVVVTFATPPPIERNQSLPGNSEMTSIAPTMFSFKSFKSSAGIQYS
jgi:hypothetical protein